MKVESIIKEIIDEIPDDILKVSKKMENKGITKEIKLSYYLYKEITKKLSEAGKEFHLADNDEQRQNFFRLNINQIDNNKVICKHINQAYKKLIDECKKMYIKDGIVLDIDSKIEPLYIDREITHSDIVLICNNKKIFCNPVLDLLESKAGYKVNNFALDLEKYSSPQYVKRLKEKYGEFYSISENDIEDLDIEIGENHNRFVQK